MRDYDEELWNIMAALAESVFDATDQEIEEESDGDPERVRAVLLAALENWHNSN
jgi:hypothetical protein